MGDSVFSFLFFSCSWRMILVFLALGGPWGEGVFRTPHYNRASWFGVGKVILEKPAAVRRGSSKAAAMALRAACSGIKIQDSKQNKTNRGEMGPVKA